MDLYTILKGDSAISAFNIRSDKTINTERSTEFHGWGIYDYQSHVDDYFIEVQIDTNTL